MITGRILCTCDPYGGTFMVNMLLGIGNSLNGDDGVGCYIAQNLDTEGWISMDCGTVPENFTGLVRRNTPDLLVLVDAADMHLSPGEYRIIPHDLIEEVGTGTHALPLSHLINFISPDVGDIVFIGIQPESLVTGDWLSERVKNSADEIIRILGEKRLESIPALEIGTGKE
jgi:hydrogenase 3 maturation protease